MDQAQNWKEMWANICFCAFVLHEATNQAAPQDTGESAAAEGQCSPGLGKAAGPPVRVSPPVPWRGRAACIMKTPHVTRGFLRLPSKLSGTKWGLHSSDLW